ncbi:MAG: CPBP family intramembrane metalloprotease [Nitrososphaerota archaeon]|nr:CPBP family intramembrane metalloprotease [Nitrososphaerota archaeon]
MPSKQLPDVIVFALFAVIPDAYFLLSTYGTPNFGVVAAYALILAIAIGALAAVQRSKVMEEIKFENNLDRTGLALSIGIGVVAFFFAGLLFGFKTFQSAILVENVKPLALGTTAVNSNVTDLLTNILWQWTMVAPAEEIMKVAAILAFYSRWKNQPMAVSAAIAMWAGLHTILAGFNWWMIFVAFVLGILFYIPLMLRGSILGSIYSHSTYNTLVKVLPYLILAGLPI